MELFWIAFLVMIIAFLGTLLLRGLLFKPLEHGITQMEQAILDQDELLNRFIPMIQCKTISYEDPALMDLSEFKRFGEILMKLYPALHQTCIREEIGPTGLLYHWKGKDPVEASVFMSHYDVVPVDEELWTKPAFDGLIHEGKVYGRGTLDTKGTLFGILEAANHLMAEGFVPRHDIYFSFSGDEEISGGSTPAIVQTLKSRGVHPVFVLDEGGAIVENIFPGVKKPCAVVGTGEKGGMDLELSLTGSGGHSSAPPVHTLVGELAEAVVRIENHPFPYHLTPPSKELFNTLGRYSGLGYRILFANLWCFLPLLNLMVNKTGGELNALLRTTCAVTRMEGSQAYNVLPPKASIGVNLRLLKNDDVQTAKNYIQKVIRNDRIQLEIKEQRNASPYSDTGSEAFKRLQGCIHKTWGDIIVSPYLMLAASDSRHYCEISDFVFRFSAMKLTKEERGLIHGNDERITVESLMETVNFYINIMKAC